jgi:hypothetical protein
MKPRARYSWQQSRWNGVFLSHEASTRLAALGSVGRDRMIANIVAGLQAKEMENYRRSARFRRQRA